MFDDWARLCWITRPWQVFALESGAEFKASESAGASNSMSEPVPVPPLRGGVVPGDATENWGWKVLLIQDKYRKMMKTVD